MGEVANLASKRKAQSEERILDTFINSFNILWIIPDSMLLDFVSVCGIQMGNDELIQQNNLEHIRVLEENKVKATKADRRRAAQLSSQSAREG